MTRYKVSFEVESEKEWIHSLMVHTLPRAVLVKEEEGVSEADILGKIIVPRGAKIEMVEEEPDPGFYVSRGSSATYQYDDGQWWVWTGYSWSTMNIAPAGTLHKLSPK